MHGCQPMGLPHAAVYAPFTPGENGDNPGAHRIIRWHISSLIAFVAVNNCERGLS
ncbi:hypothetical protein EaACW_1444 [Erwinia amylovora ACW56400]|uniref:Uncharacterized protein n=3 Tax=Erwinia amylovora TaxID=552 RepID=A0A831A2F3_ERWAM|nr:hypothetical protein EaACW_1444 [Erwinia amylovora ACW56400]CBA20388.1 hypothetical protein predicted by Glimmer/Critica [Erwinia amylovora CFBP1430]CBJ46101.1 hypothetical protein EAM_1426 [Erwinia amylovora ATCC 49946]CCO78292.1 hypothetical protein BN432_1488 [Erwinia amylovora Ea356]CCO82081.1 hypothetical protein BN433_1503 [Erwinia amylovora Ea266]CCO85877.1 hypothetical protein BN434_1483 [Erwinia amylovora CFBP 2585]CCO89664.1 hypothetical protein BN435_1486 [Erwinia amylovora 01SF